MCPIPHDGAFMQKFYEAWRIVRAFLDADAKMPPAAALPRPEERYVADILTQRRDGSRINGAPDTQSKCDWRSEPDGSDKYFVIFLKS